MEQTKKRAEVGKEGVGIRQRACMNDPRTWAVVWGLTGGMGVRTEWSEAEAEKLRQV